MHSNSLAKYTFKIFLNALKWNMLKCANQTDLKYLFSWKDFRKENIRQ